MASSETGFSVIRTNLGDDAVRFEGSPGFWELRYNADNLTQVVSSFDASTDTLTLQEFIGQTLVGTDRVTGVGNIAATGGLSYYGTTEADNFTGTPAAFERLRYIGGNDTFQGGEGVDEVDLRAATTGATVDLAAGTAVLAQGDQLSLADVERVRGTSFDDSLTGNSDFNSFRPGGGNDTLDGGLNSTRDEFRAVSASQAANIDLTLSSGQIVSDGFGGTDTILNNSVSDFRLTNFADSFVGDSNRQFIYGDDGDDTIVAGGGDDTIQVLGDGENDSVVGGDGTDWVIFAEAFSAYTIDASGPEILATYGATGETDRLSEVEFLVFSDQVRDANLNATTAFVGLSVADASVAEGDSGVAALSFVVSQSAVLPQDNLFTYSLSATTATSGTDYAPRTGFAWVKAGETSATVSIPVFADTASESNETFQITIASTRGSIISDATATGTIIDDDGAPTLSISDASVTEADSFARTMTFTVSLSEAATSEVTVQYATSDGTATAGAGASGTAAGTSDYTATSGTLTFAAGETSKTVSVSVTGDIAIESDETFTVTLSNASGATLSDATATGTITENEVSVWSGQAYVDANPDLVSAGVTAATALDHYAAFGYAENRLISFDAAAYLEVNPDVAAAGITTANAITHYINFGKNENRPFTADAYLNANPDLVAAGLDAAGAGAHYANFGKNESRSPGFDAAGYALLNQDLVTAGFTVSQFIEHWNNFGQAEGRSVFDPGQYFAANTSVATAGSNAYLHYQDTGKAAGLSITKQSIFLDVIGIEGL
ncbi:MAG: hypothetical protein NXI16_00450 [Alphaproteobacteria bacterium]|nr:hypothetical protein [Alphaproteobacteria bacterium]